MIWGDILSPVIDRNSLSYDVGVEQSVAAGASIVENISIAIGALLLRSGVNLRLFARVFEANFMPPTFDR